MKKFLFYNIPSPYFHIYNSLKDELQRTINSPIKINTRYFSTTIIKAAPTQHELNIAKHAERLDKAHEKSQKALDIIVNKRKQKAWDEEYKQNNKYLSDENESMANRTMEVEDQITTMKSKYFTAKT